MTTERRRKIQNEYNEEMVQFDGNCERSRNHRSDFKVVEEVAPHGEVEEFSPEDIEKI